MKTLLRLDSPQLAATLTTRALRLMGSLVATVGLAVVVAGPAHATIVTNGGFETRDFTGWTQTGNTGFAGVQCPGAAFVSEGNCDAFFGPVGSDGGISQSLSLTVGQQYKVTFAFEPDGSTPSDFSASLGGATLLSLTNPAASGFQSFSFVATATAATESLAFSFRDDPGFLFLDAVSVAAVPEPATLALLGLGLAGLGFLRRKQ